MAHIIPNSTGYFSPSPRVSFLTKKNKFLVQYSFARKLKRKPLPSERCRLPLSVALKFFPRIQYRCNRLQTLEAFAGEADVAVEEESDVGQVNLEASVSVEGKIGDSSAKPDANTVRVKRSRPVRKSEMPAVKNEELLPGATFNGKVRSIQPFGAFIDFGAFTDGLVHVSQLSDSFVKDVASVVSVGQEVKVRLVEVNLETGRISLSMRDNADVGRKQQQKDGPVNGDKSGPPRRAGPRNGQRKDEPRKTSKFVKGQDIVGTVKNLVRAGAFISLPEGEEGFLPTSEEADEGFVNMMGGSSLEVDQEVNVRVLRITRGKITLTMKKEGDVGELDSKLNQGVVHKATNPFALAFRSNKEISSFLDGRKKDVEPHENVQSDSTDGGDPGLEDLAEAFNKEEDDTDLREDDKVSDVIGLQNDYINFASSVESEEILEEPTDDISTIDGNLITEEPAQAEAKEANDSEISGEVIDGPASTPEVVEESAIEAASDAILLDEPPSTEEPAQAEAKEVDDSEISGEVIDGPASTPEIVDESAIEGASDAILIDEEQSEIAQTDPSLSSEVLGEITTAGLESTTKSYYTESQTEESVRSDLDAIGISGTDTSGTLVSETPEESIDEVKDQLERSEESSNEETAASDPEESSSNESSFPQTAAESQAAVNGVQVETSADQGKNLNTSGLTEPTAAISPALVKQLRDETGAGMMDCKKALSETEGDIVKAQEYLRKKGLASADKKASRVTAEGRIGSYIHDSRIGVLIEVNCETDFVARGEIFKELVEDLAMQVAACPQVEYLSTEDIPAEIVDKEKEIEAQKDDLLSKPELIRSKIVDGRVSKRLGELALLEQHFIKDDKIVVKDWVKQTISTIGENIKVKRFERYNLGEGLEKKSHDFAAEVAAQTAAKSSPASVVKQQPEPNVEKPTEKAPVSAALVKKLREETGAGMMDCKKALTETGGEFDKAQEYLRKKGLSSADKKSSRLAAEGRIGSYIHDSRIGVLIEVNCETDFVGRSEAFKELVDDLAMQAVACPQVQYVSIEDIPESICAKEKQLEMQREDILSKPENIRDKIVEGRLTKRLAELTLLEQPFIRNDSVLIKDLVKQTVAALGENIKVRRFARFTLGETDDAESKPEA